jgi:hypothetical protein
MHKKTKSDIERLEVLIQQEEDELAECVDPTKYRELERKLQVLEMRLDDLNRKYS